MEDNSFADRLTDAIISVTLFFILFGIFLFWAVLSEGFVTPIVVAFVFLLLGVVFFWLVNWN